MSKAVGGQMPLACIVFKEELNAWPPGAHTGTFRGNTLSFVGGTATIKHMVAHGFAERAVRQWDSHPRPLLPRSCCR